MRALADIMIIIAAEIFTCKSS